jgi:hypothetical protein
VLLQRFNIALGDDDDAEAEKRAPIPYLATPTLATQAAEGAREAAGPLFKGNVSRSGHAWRRLRSQLSKREHRKRGG